MSKFNGRAIAYWTTTGLLAAEFLMGGAFAVAQPPVAVEGMHHLGYPVYFGVLLGVWKLLGAVALLAPRTPRIKEWAYAGIFFDLTGAAVSHAASGDGVGDIVAPLLFVALLVASYALRPASRTLAPVELPRAGVNTTRLETA